MPSGKLSFFEMKWFIPSHVLITDRHGVNLLNGEIDSSKLILSARAYLFSLLNFVLKYDMFMLQIYIRLPSRSCQTNFSRIVYSANQMIKHGDILMESDKNEKIFEDVWSASNIAKEIIDNKET